MFSACSDNLEQKLQKLADNEIATIGKALSENPSEEISDRENARLDSLISKLQKENKGREDFVELYCRTACVFQMAQAADSTNPPLVGGPLNEVIVNVISELESYASDTPESMSKSDLEVLMDYLYETIQLCWKRNFVEKEGLVAIPANSIVHIHELMEQEHILVHKEDLQKQLRALETGSGIGKSYGYDEIITFLDEVKESLSKARTEDQMVLVENYQQAAEDMLMNINSQATQEQRELLRQYIDLINDQIELKYEN